MLVKVIPKDNFTLELYLNDGTIRIFDVKPYLGYEAFKDLNNIDNFRKFEIDELGGIDWLQGGSFSQDTLLNKSTLISLKEN